MSLAQIKAAIAAGKTVHWANASYTVILDSVGQYLIAYLPGTNAENYIGLTWLDGVTMNGDEDQFFIGASA